jgi:hypothetical protein
MNSEKRCVVTKKLLTEKNINLLSQRVSTMLTCPAEGCPFITNGDRSLTNHVKKCTKATTGLASVGKEARRREADSRQAKRRRISSPERSESVPGVGEPMDVDPEVRSVKKYPKRFPVTVVVLAGWPTASLPTSNRQPSAYRRT